MRRPRVISSLNAEYLRYELDTGDATRQKNALQEISRLYRAGSQFSLEVLNGIESTINGLVLSNQDEKVVRWCLNAIAQLGRLQNCQPYVEAALKKHESRLEIVASAVAALGHLFRGELDAASGLAGVDPSIKVLAALQTTDPRKLDLSGIRIEIETANVEVIKLALIAIGMNRDVENLFHPRHTNGTIVKALGQYPEATVRQYSVWSVLGNVRLTIADLGIPYDDIENEQPNVQAKLLQLIAERETDAQARHEQILRGTYLPSDLARRGISKGLLNNYYEGLPEITLDWFNGERDAGIREDLVEHFGRFADQSPSYEELAMEIAEQGGQQVRRLMRGAEGKKLYGVLREKDIRAGTADLFSGSAALSIPPSKRPSPMSRKIALVLSASPRDEMPLRLDQEARDLREQLQLVIAPSSRIDVEHRWAVRTDQLQAELLNVAPDILHFSGHGGKGSLVFEDRNGEAFPVSAIAFSGLVATCGSVECVLLNACFSETVAKEVAPHVQAVIGCDDSIADEAAIAFSRAFYRALAHGRTYEGAFNLAKNEVQLNGQEDEAAKYKFMVR